MNAREKKIAIMAYQMAVALERHNAKPENNFNRRRTDSPEGMALTWATQSEFNGTWDYIEKQVEGL